MQVTGQATADELAGTLWRISSRSDAVGPECVEAGALPDGSGRVAVRHSHHPDATVLVYTADDWCGFLTALHHGEFDF